MSVTPRRISLDEVCFEIPLPQLFDEVISFIDKSVLQYPHDQEVLVHDEETFHANLESLSSQIANFQTVPTEWKKFRAFLEEHSLLLISLSSALIALGALIAVGGLLILPLAIVGITLAAIGSLFLVLRLAAFIVKKQDDSQILAHLRDLKFCSAISAQEYVELRSSLIDRSQLHLKMRALLVKWHQDKRIPPHLFDLVSKLLNLDLVKESLEILDLVSFKGVSIDLNCLIKNGEVEMKHWSSFYERFSKEKDRKTIEAWIFSVSRIPGFSRSANELGERLEDNDFEGFLQKVSVVLLQLQEKAFNECSQRPLHLFYILSRIEGVSTFEEFVKLLREEEYYAVLEEKLNAFNEKLSLFKEHSMNELELKSLLASLHHFYSGFCRHVEGHFRDEFSEDELRKWVAHFQDQWRSINDTAEIIQNGVIGCAAPLHMTCGCHLAQIGDTLPLVDNNVIDGVNRVPEISAENPEPLLSKKPTVLIFTTKMGAGNKMTTKAITSALEDRAHVALSLSSSEFEENIWNWLCSGGWWRTISCVRDLFPPTEEGVIAKFQEAVQRQIELHKPDVVMVCWPWISPACLRECEKKGIPLVAFGIDCTVEEYLRFMPSDAPNLYVSIPAEDTKMRQEVSKVLGDHVFVSGSPINKVFKNEKYRGELRSQTEAEIRSDLKGKICPEIPINGVPDSAKIVTIQAGSLGFRRPLEELTASIANSDSSLQDGSELYVFVCCGNNTEIYEELKAKYSDSMMIKNKWIKIIPLPRIPQENLANLYAITHALCGKAGGGTIFEAKEMGTYMLMDNDRLQLDALYWEDADRRYVESEGYGESYDDGADFERRLFAILNGPRRIHCPSDTLDFAQEVRTIFDQLTNKMKMEECDESAS